MPIQLSLLAENAPAIAIDSPWSQLPEQARSEVVELFAELLVSCARCASSVEEPAHESFEDTNNPHQP
jgi:hypothetical protein